ncbi:MAG: alanine--glyoxylate aminotransferase family protein [Myxococcales bacterium]|nr:alanine--glyoxylate aminotransferase family protein [Myxococcales bacterium]
MQPLLMIPGPIEVSPAVREAAATAPPSHTAPGLIEAFGASLGAMRSIWRAPEGAQPFVLAGSGTLAMEMAATNLVEPGQSVLVVHHGYFGARMADMLSRRGARVRTLATDPGHAVPADQVDAELSEEPAVAVFVTHVDTSTGVRADVAGIAAMAKAHGAMVVVDGVCSTVGEVLDQARLDVDVFLTASQKAVGAPPGLALLVASPLALQARSRLLTPPPMSLDFEQWIPIMEAYEQRRPSYFATPATSLVLALRAALTEIEDHHHAGHTGVEAAWVQHAQVAQGMRAAWQALGCSLLPATEEVAANTLSALRYPEGVGPELVAAVGRRGVAVAGGLLPQLKQAYFRVGHMGWVTRQPELLERTVRAIGEALVECGHATDPEAGVAALRG